MSDTIEKAKQKVSVIKKVPGICVLYSDDTIRLDNVRLSYPHVATPQKNTSDDGVDTYSYNVTCLLPKATHGEARKICADLMTKLMADKKFTIPAAKKFIKNGDAVDDDGARIMGPECEGMYVVSAREKNRPMLRGKKLDPATGKPMRLTPEDAEQLFYGGCYANVLIRPWLQDNKFGKRINAGLSAVQFLRDGEPFGQRLREADIDDRFDGEEADEWGGGGDDDDLG